MMQPDEKILDHIWRSLWADETISYFDIHDISVDVENGQVCISGHVSKDQNFQRIEEIFRSIPGVKAIHNHLVTDCALSNQVTQALRNCESAYSITLTVNTCHGWVELDGSVPNLEIQRIVEATAANVPDVRGVIRVPALSGEQSALERVVVQPRIGVNVFGKDETQGFVYQVVITPQNRLVTHAIVRVNRSSNGWRESCDYLIPVEAMKVVDANGIFLDSPEPAIHQFPGFTASEYPFAPLTWQPPFPYAVGNVCWPYLEKMNVE